MLLRTHTLTLHRERRMATIQTTMMFTRTLEMTTMTNMNPMKSATEIVSIIGRQHLRQLVIDCICFKTIDSSPILSGSDFRTLIH
jgi:hypothetical protein